VPHNKRLKETENQRKNKLPWEGWSAIPESRKPHTACSTLVHLTSSFYPTSS